ncbi:MAG: acyl-CoA thioesterase [Myxococcales bacterium]|nr:acyl-CoA thioesterase [Myxococcales bacterium]
MNSLEESSGVPTARDVVPKDERFRFSHRIPVRFADTDAQGHVFFANYLTFFDETLTAYMRAIGCPWQRMIELGVDIVYADSRCQHRGRSFFEDELLIQGKISRIGDSSITSRYRAFRGENQLVAEGQLVCVCVDRQNKRKVGCPEELRQAVARYEAGESQADDSGAIG